VFADEKATWNNRCFFPVSAALIVSGSISKEMDIATVAWVGMVSSTPPAIGISMINEDIPWV
jgi:flavin reductase (DIM6/NTAB) family NADH-FMN oxidoreductase RutF